MSGKHVVILVKILVAQMFVFDWLKLDLIISVLYLVCSSKYNHDCLKQSGAVRTLDYILLQSVIYLQIKEMTIGSITLPNAHLMPLHTAQSQPTVKISIA